MKSLEDLEKVSHDYLGILWATRKSLSLYGPTGQLLNYLSDGLLGRGFPHHHKNLDQDLFCTVKQFGSPFFIFHKKITSQNKETLNPDIFSSFFSRFEEIPKDAKVLIISEESESIISEWEKLYPEIPILKFQDL